MLLTESSGTPRLLASSARSLPVANCERLKASSSVSVCSTVNIVRARQSDSEDESVERRALNFLLSDRGEERLESRVYDLTSETFQTLTKGTPEPDAASGLGLGGRRRTRRGSDCALSVTGAGRPSERLRRMICWTTFLQGAFVGMFVRS